MTAERRKRKRRKNAPNVFQSERKKIKVLITFACEIEHFSSSVWNLVMGVASEYSNKIHIFSLLSRTFHSKLNPRKWINKITRRDEMAYEIVIEHGKSKSAKKRMLKHGSIPSAKQCYTSFFLLYFILYIASLWLIHPDFALILYHFALRIPIMYHEIDINKNPIPPQSEFGVSLLSSNL